MRRISREAGFTLIELMISLAITSVVVTMVYGLFVAQQRAMKTQGDTVDVDESGRVGMELMVRDIRNSGFLLPNPKGAVMIEDNCGAAGNTMAYTPSTGVWAVRGGTSAMNGGDVIGLKTKIQPANATPLSEACPNGSDRITVFGRPDMIAPTACNGAGCMANNIALGASIDIPCRNASPTTVGSYLTDCKATLDQMSPDVDLPCAGGVAFSTTACLQDDPTNCQFLPVTTAVCNNNCNINGGGVMACVRLTISGFSGSSWATNIGGSTGGDNLVVGGYTARSYQLLDLDQNGSTELVYSDHLREGLLDPGSTGNVDPRWVVVAEHVDDLQFAWSVATPANFDPRSLYNVLPCTEDATPDPGTNALGGFACLDTRIQALTPPRAIRVSMIARSRLRDKNARDTSGNGIRTTLENNFVSAVLRPPQPYSTVPATITGYGCTVANYEDCSGNGNANGFRRRILSETVAMRNLLGFNR